jgi:diguanylate cyclase (GGDEF)-like protein
MDKSFIKKIVILYVEDEDDLREITTNILEKFVDKVIAAKDGLEGLAKFKEHYEKTDLPNIDLIVADINMPKMDGLTMLEKILEIDNYAASVITTAHSDADFLKRAIDCKVRGYVTKPLKVDKLIGAVALAAEPVYLKKELEQLNAELLDQVEEKTKEVRSILDFQENMILVLNNNKISSANKRFLEFLGVSSIDEITKDHCVSEYFLDGESYFVPSEEQNWLKEIMQLDDVKRIVQMKSSTGRKKILRVDVRSFMNSSKHYVISFTDITELQKYTDELRYQADHDGLTKLFNRQRFSEELRKEILRENRYQHKLSIIMFDIDNFKVINDTYGHDVGDTVLVRISQVTKDTVRVTDIVSRWGGEEFMVLLPETSIEETSTIAEHVRKNIENLQFDEIDSNITVSLGVSEYIANQDTQEKLLKNVDMALYEAKRTGKNKVVKL